MDRKFLIVIRKKNNYLVNVCCCFIYLVRVWKFINYLFFFCNNCKFIENEGIYSKVKSNKIKLFIIFLSVYIILILSYNENFYLVFLF